jgi:hypothetical protein
LFPSKWQQDTVQIELTEFPRNFEGCGVSETRVEQEFSASRSNFGACEQKALLTAIDSRAADPTKRYRRHKSRRIAAKQPIPGIDLL